MTMQDAGRVTAKTQLQIGIGLLLGLLLLAMTNYLAFRHYRRFDWTASHAFTLSSRTKQVLRGLDRDVTVYLFVSPQDQLYADLDELLTSYRSYSTRLRVRRIDPASQQGEYRLVAGRFGISTLTSQDGEDVANVDVVIEAGDKHWSIRRDDLVAVDMEAESDQGPVLDVQTERALTGGILEAISGRSTKVCVASGHGEYALAGAGARTLATLQDHLRHDNVELESVELVGRTPVPPACDALMIVGPQRAYSADEAGVLGAYVDGGGKLLAALDPILDEHTQVTATGLETVLRSHGIVLGRDLVLELDPQHLLGGDSTEVFAVDSFGDHPAVAALRAIHAGVAFHSARSVSTAEGDAASVLAQTTERAYAESDVAALARGQMLEPGAGDLRGPIGIAAIYPGSSTAPPGGSLPSGRLVVVGDADWLRGDLIDQPMVANADLVDALVGTLTNRRALVSIAPRRVHAQALLMPADGPRSIFVRVVVLLPMAFALLGFSVWWSRRT